MDGKRVFVAGHKGMVGSAIRRELERQGDCEIIVRSREQLDLRNQMSVQKFFDSERIDQVYLAAAKVGGIYANSSYPADFIYDNLMIQSNVIHSAFNARVVKLLFLGSSCIYPRDSQKPIDEAALLSGYLEKTNEPYALAKIAGIKLCESYNRQFGESDGIDFRALMPTNLYGLGDNYHPDNSHVIPGLIRRFHDAKIAGLDRVFVWGTGKPRREFLFSEDFARACVKMIGISKQRFVEVVGEESIHLNIGSGNDISIGDLAQLIKDIIGYKGEIQFNSAMPDGTFRKLLDSGKAKQLGFQSNTGLEEGLVKAYQDFLSRGLG